MFVQPDFAVSVTYPDPASAEQGLKFIETFAPYYAEYVTVDAEQEGRIVAVSGHVRPKAIALLK